MLKIDGDHLSFQDVLWVARKGEPVELADSAVNAIQTSRKRMEALLQSPDAVYGVNTGFGIFSDRRIDPGEAAQLSRNLILSHAVGSGAPLPVEVVRTAMLVRANTLAKGFSGVRLEIVSTLLAMLNLGVTPLVPSQGSLGSSGDLCPLSHLALVFSTDEHNREQESGQAIFNGQVMSGMHAMHKAGIPRLVLQAKEGLAVNNGATFSAALAALAAADTLRLLELADLCAAMSLEAFLGCPAAFDPRIHAARNHPGQIQSAGRIRCLTEGSTLVGSTHRVQDAYSLRCAPQVHGSAIQAVEHVCCIIEREINAVTDNPLIFGEGDVLSGGNFHGEPIALGMDYLGIALAELGAISERRMFRLMDEKTNAGLPPMLVGKPELAGLNSGLMMLQYTAASLVLENQRLASPDSVLSLPTSGGQEDHNANAMTAARKARQMVENTTHILALELFATARAIYLRLRQHPSAILGKGTAAVYEILMQNLDCHDGDCWWLPEIEKVRGLIDAGVLPLDSVVHAEPI